MRLSSSVYSYMPKLFSTFSSDIATILERSESPQARLVSPHGFSWFRQNAGKGTRWSAGADHISGEYIELCSSFNRTCIHELNCMNFLGGDRLDGGEGAAALHHSLPRRRRHPPRTSPPSLCSCLWLSSTEEGNAHWG